jgi:hypothetical protein
MNCIRGRTAEIGTGAAWVRFTCCSRLAHWNEPPQPTAPLPLGPFLGTCSLAESRIHRGGSVETNREKVAAPAVPSQSAGAV